MSSHGKRWRHRHKTLRRPVPASPPPGSIVVDPHAPKPVVQVMAYGPQQFQETTITSVDDVTLLREKFPLVWVNVDGLGDAELIQHLGRLFQLHPLALEDTVNTHQRSKVDDFGDILYVVARMVSGLPLQTEQLSLFVGRDFVVTFQEDVSGDCLNPVRERLRQNRGRIRTSGPDYLLYELLDAVIDGYFPLVEQYGRLLDDLDVAASQPRPSRHLISDIHRVRGDLLFLRRITWPHRDAVLSLLRGGHTLITQDTMPYFRDCYDHTVQLIDIQETFRESCADLRDLYFTQQGNRTNEIMRTLTIIATLFMPLSFIAGVYGMNFDWMPEIKWPWGYPMALTLMACVAIGMLSFFYRKGWLRSMEQQPTDAPSNLNSSNPPPTTDK